MTVMTGGRTELGRAVIERASASDRAFLAMDTGQVPEQFGVLLTLYAEGEGEGGLDLASARLLLADRIRAVPRLRQRLVRVPLGCGGPIWVDDTQFDIRRHVRAVACPKPGREQQLLDTAVSVISEPLPRDAPLWAAVLITSPTGGALPLVIVLHHALADGIGGLAVLRGLIDAPREGSGANFPRSAPLAPALAREAFRARLRGLRRASQSWQLLRRSMAAAAAGRPLLAEPAHRAAPTAGGGPRRPRRRSGRRASAWRYDQRRRSRRGGRRAAPGPARPGRIGRRTRDDRAGVGPRPGGRAGPGQHGQSHAGDRSGDRRTAGPATTGRGTSPRAEGGRDRAAPDRVAGLAVPAPGRARRLSLVPQPPAPIPHAGHARTRARSAGHLRGRPGHLGDPGGPRPRRERAGLLRGALLCGHTDGDRDRRPRSFP